MRRFSRPLLFTFLALLSLLVVIALALFLKKPIPVATDDDDDDDGDQPSALAVSGAHGPSFDATFGSLAALVPQGGSAPVLNAAAGVAGSAMADAGSGAPDGGMPVGHGDQFRDLAWLRSQPADSYTLQVLAARSESAVKQFIAGQKNPDQFHYFQSVEGGQPWFVVVYGSYGSRVQAIGTATGLDFGLDTRPFAKAFSDYAGDISGSAQGPAPAADSTAAPALTP